MEVGSPGLGRKLTRDAHFEALKGQKVLAHLYRATQNGEKDLEGILCEKQGKTLTLTQNGEQRTVDMADVSYVKLCDDEDLF